jgi:hypothetical protein
MSRWEELYVEFLGNERERRSNKNNSNNCAEAQLYGKTAGACGTASANASSDSHVRALEVLTFDCWPANAEVESIESTGYPDDSGRAGVVAMRLITAVVYMHVESLTPYLRQHQAAQEAEGVVYILCTVWKQHHRQRCPSSPSQVEPLGAIGNLELLASYQAALRRVG